MKAPPAPTCGDAFLPGNLRHLEASQSVRPSGASSRHSAPGPRLPMLPAKRAAPECPPGRSPAFHTRVSPRLPRLAVLVLPGLLLFGLPAASAQDTSLYLGPEDAATPLVPEDHTYESLEFFTLREGLKAPVEFKAREDGSLMLVVERNVFHKEQ